MVHLELTTMTRKISIDGIIFHVEPVGYEILRAYLDAWNKYNRKGRAHWEEQVAEYLLQKLRNGSAVTSTQDVQGLNEILKEVPFKIDSSESTDEPKKSSRLGQYIAQIAMGLW